jgi:hypothetical protein
MFTSPPAVGPLLVALGIHTLAAYLAVTSLVAWVVFARVGLAILSTAVQPRLALSVRARRNRRDRAGHLSSPVPQ